LPITTALDGRSGASRIAADRTGAEDWRLRSFRAEYGNRARRGLLLHNGDMLEWLTPDVLAAPWWRVL
jgi:hypothetical protein